MASAVQTVCGQAYGAKKYAAMCITLQRAIILHFGAAVILTFLYWFSGDFLKAIWGRPRALLHKAKCSLADLFLNSMHLHSAVQCRGFCKHRNIVNPQAYMAVGLFLLHMLLSWLVIYVLGYDLLGAALTLSFSWWILVFLNGLYIIFSPKCKETWTGFTVKAFIGIWPYFKFTVASAVMVWYDHMSTSSFSLQLCYFNLSHLFKICTKIK
jgi:multidrug resistance protein, MATE family